MTEHRNRAWWLAAACCAVLAAGCVAPRQRSAAGPGGVPDIRVLLAEGEPETAVASSGGFHIEAMDGLKILESRDKGTARITLQATSVNVAVEPDGGVGAVEGAIRIVPGRGAVLSFAGAPYGGTIWIAPDGRGGLTVTNVLSLETYLEGVLPHEMGNPGPEGYAALQSQAVAARTYAYSKIASRRGEGFDVHATVQDQVYRGLDGRSRAASSAVRDTRGRILEYEGAPARAYYSACCGGHTSDIRRVWPEREPAGYLFGMVDRTARENRAFCADNRYFRWRYSFSGRQLGDVLRVTIPKELGVDAADVGELRDIRVTERTPSGRVSGLEIETTKRTFALAGDRIRWVLMADVDKGRILPSVMFRLEKMMERDRVDFVSIVGGGNGHGVGMCQNGAIAMARKGYTFSMILSHYYPGCTITKLY